ncbi:MAG: hybrid sensor histidine kinase/response regulator [Chloroflexota bacterium]
MVDQTTMTSQTPKILYIDDDPVNRSLVNRLLSSYNFNILEAETGLEGIDIARAELPNLILMDINMPGLDGHETTTRMRSIPALEKIPIVAVTARTTKGERELALVAGCDGYIPKPIDIDNFPHQIISYLDGYRDTISLDQQQLYLGHYSKKLVERLETKIIELEEANKKLQKVDKLKSDFITLAAHELRTPITLIYGYARLLQLATGKNVGGDNEQAGINDLATRIFNSVFRLNEAINDILNISLIEADEMHLVYQPVSLVQIINAALRELNPAKHDRHLTIGLEELDPLPNLIGDAQRLQQVFWNLLSNAIKFTPDGGSILIKGWVVDSCPRPQRQTARPHAAAKRPGGVVIMIKDSGIGINPEEHEEIFERFYIVANTAYHSSSKIAFGGGGMGLGLSIARGIIEAHGGQIWVESERQDVKTTPGSSFFLFLPLDGPQK